MYYAGIFKSAAEISVFQVADSFSVEGTTGRKHLIKLVADNIVWLEKLGVEPCSGIAYQLICNGHSKTPLRFTM